MKKKNLLMTTIAIFGLATISIAQTVPSYVPTSGLVGWWPFSGNANDSSGNNNNGTVMGATLTIDRFGNANSAYQFDGSSSYITIPNSSSLQSPGYRLSMTAWVNLAGYSLVGQPFNPILSKNNNGANAYMYRFTVDFVGLGFYASVNNWNNNTGGFGDTLINSEWYLLTAVLDSNISYFYLNDSLIGSQAFTTNITADNYPLEIGRDMPGITEIFNGKIDDVGIWNRALTQQEINNLYNGCQISVNTQPASQTININNDAQFIAGSSDPGVTYQWQTNLGGGFQNLNSSGQFSGTNDDTLILSNATMSNNNQLFRCIISSGTCTDTSSIAVLTVVNNVGINEVSQNNLFSVYPNPADDQINVMSDAQLLGSAYTIYDNTGKLVLSGKINSENTVIDLGNLSGGIYLFNMGENMKQTFKAIKK
jgi:hypothetical protein